MQKTNIQFVVFTDLDGTLLDHDTYSYSKAAKALSLIKKHKIPLIICTSKTRSEIDYYRKKLGNRHPFISENGGAIFIPKDYFSFQFKYDKKDKNYFIVQMGTDYKKLINVLKNIQKQHPLKLFYDMSLAELAKDTGLTLQQAKLAKQREFDEAFEIVYPKDTKKVLADIRKAGFRYTVGGRYVHIMGANDKGEAVKLLSTLFKRQFGTIETVGLGDSPNDFAMLDKVDKPYLVMKKDRRYTSQQYSRAGGIGPIGWGNIILKLFK